MNDVFSIVWAAGKELKNYTAGSNDYTAERRLSGRDFT
jgi:hypothetical protein